MVFVLDANIYVFAFGIAKEENCKTFLKIISEHPLYEWKGLKPADALIAAYCEWTGADILVTENRHFLSRHSDLPFKVLSAEKCLKLLIKTSS